MLTNRQRNGLESCIRAIVADKQTVGRIIQAVRAADDASPKLLTVNEAAVRLNVSRHTIRAWMKRGLLPKVRIKGARCVRVPQNAVEALIQGGVPPEEDSVET